MKRHSPHPCLTLASALLLTAGSSGRTAHVPKPGEPLWVSVAPLESGTFDPAPAILAIGVTEMLTLEFARYPEVVCREFEVTTQAVRKVAVTASRLKVGSAPKLISPHCLVKGSLTIAYDAAVLNLHLETKERRLAITAESLSGSLGKLPVMVADGTLRVMAQIRGQSPPPKVEQTGNASSFDNQSLLQYSRAVSFLQQRKPMEALNALHECLQKSPDFVPALIASGTALFLGGKFQESLEPFATTLKLQPELASVRYRYALALAVVGSKSEAQSEFKTVMADRPNDYLAEDAAKWFTALDRK